MKRFFLSIFAAILNWTALKLMAAAQMVLSISQEAHQSFAQSQHRLNDWAQLEVYRQANIVLPPPAPIDKRVVFFGDSITQFWDLAFHFPDQPYINRGISGQTTPQMLLRFRADVIALQPRVVVILAGTNDLAGNTGPMTLDMIEDNYASIAELAKIHQIRVVFASVLPVHDYGVTQVSNSRPPTRIQALNQWLKGYCTANNCVYLDYYSRMLDDQDMLRAELSDDGLHPNVKGYEVMASLAATAIQQALK